MHSGIVFSSSLGSLVAGRTKLLHVGSSKAIHWMWMSHARISRSRDRCYLDRPYHRDPIYASASLLVSNRTYRYPKLRPVSSPYACCLSRAGERSVAPLLAGWRKRLAILIRPLPDPNLANLVDALGVRRYHRLRQEVAIPSFVLHLASYRSRL